VSCAAVTRRPRMSATTWRAPDRELGVAQLRLGSGKLLLPGGQVLGQPGSLGPKVDRAGDVRRDEHRGAGRLDQSRGGRPDTAPAASRRPNARTAARCSPSRLRPDRTAGPRPDGCLEDPARYGTGAARDRFLRRRDRLRSLHADLLEVVNRDMR
jgi:hypothetical protein